MTDPGEPEAFDDVNQAVRDEWTGETTPYERIREVISRTYTPTDAETLADKACTSFSTPGSTANWFFDGTVKFYPLDDELFHSDYPGKLRTRSTAGD